MESDSRHVVGYCPMGCGETLFLGNGGNVTCSLIGCPAPWAVDDLLHDRETEHVVELGATEFTVRHPLRERLNDELMTCELHDYLANLDGPPRPQGRYRATKHGGRWLFSAMPFGEVPSDGR